MRRKIGNLAKRLRAFCHTEKRGVREYDEIYAGYRIRESKNAATAQTGQDLQSDRRIDKAIAYQLLAVWAAR